jgi:hypothetical protein
MRLQKAQREALLSWVAEGLESDAINQRAAAYEQPFSVSRGLVDYYRKTRKIDLKKLALDGQVDALNTGLAIKGERVKRLQLLAALLEEDLFSGMVWIDDVKGVGNGDIAQIVEFERFNDSEISQYRGILDDIAKEVGGRVQKNELTGAGGGAIEQTITTIEVIKDHGK